MEDRPLTPEEVAEELRVSRFTVYDLIKRGELQAFRVGRKMRVLSSSLRSFTAASQPPQPAPAAKSGFVICGQDIVLDVLVQHLNYELAGLRFLRSHDGSCNALWAFYHGQAQIASAHLWDADSNEYNIPYVRRLVPGTDVLLVNLLYRQAGFYTAVGNPKGLSDWSDLLRPGIRMVNRELGSGIRVLSDEKLKQLGADPSQISGYEQVESSHPAVASAVARGQADVGIETEKVALHVGGVEFVALQRERYDLVIRTGDAQKEPYSTVLAVLNRPAFQEEVAALGGYDVSEMGKIIARI